MQLEQIHEIINRKSLPGMGDNNQLIETHISWLILSDKFVYKIKRPVKFSFLDYSDIEKRAFYCQREIFLNRRLAPRIYLDVIPVFPENVGHDKGQGDKPIDYAVKMKKMDPDKQMDKLLAQAKVKKQDIQKIARVLARFHKKADVIKNVFDVRKFKNDFNDILSIEGFSREKMGEEWGNKIQVSIPLASAYMDMNRPFLNERVITSCIRDGHGDLNGSNIFLYDEPIIYDCIEFNDAFRRVDVLNDLAFLAIDLEGYGEGGLAQFLYGEYMKAYGAPMDEATRRLFNFYKAYRANVRAKVTLLHARQDPENATKLLESAKTYLGLMEKYLIGLANK